MAYTKESWQETALLTIYDGATYTNFALITESFEFNTGDKEIEGLPLVNGGRIAKWTPEADTEFTAKIIPLGVGAGTETSATGFWQKFQPPAALVSTDPIAIQNTRNRSTYTVAAMWATSFPGNAIASASVSSAATTRLSMRNAYITSLKNSFSTSDGLMADITIKCPAFGKDGSSNVKMESCDGSLAALATLTWT